jgi:Lysophospholipase
VGLKKNHVRIETTDGQIHTMVHSPSGTPKLVIVFSHGFTVPGFESRRMFLDLADRSVQLGMTAVLFDYRGSGYSDKRFEEMTINTEIADLHRILDFTMTDVAQNAPVVLWGMSLGTAVAAAVAAERQKDLRAVLFWCVSTHLYERFSSRYDQKLLASGKLFLPSGFLVTPQLIDAMKDVDTLESIGALQVPKLFVTGLADDQTPVELTREAFEKSREPKDMFLIPGGNHGFKGQPELFEEATGYSLAWLQRVTST